MPEDSFGLAGHVIDGQFQAIEVAGSGGFGVVYRGQHLTLREPIAIKCLKLKLENASPAVVAQFTQRFFDESRIMYRLSQGNLNIVRAITTGVTKSPKTGETVPYMVLEWLEGTSLSAELKDRRARKAPPPPLAEVMAMFEPAALAIAYAHEQGVVHRDVKPGNLFLQNTREGRRQMKVLDFGMAKVLQPQTMGGIESAETLAGVTVLSPQYVTPEQLDKSMGAMGPWTDVYAFALILVEALTNRRARDAETFVALMTQIAKPGAAPTPRRRGADVNDAVERVFERALSRDPTARQPTMGAFWAELVDAARSKERLDMTTVDDPDANDGKTTIDMHVPMPMLAGTMIMGDRPAAPKPDLGKTMPLTGPNAPPQPNALRDLAGTARMSPPASPVAVTAPAPSSPQVAAIEAMRPSTPEPARPFTSPRPSAPKPAPTAPSGASVTPSTPSFAAHAAPAKAPRPNRAVVAVLLLFVLASLGVSGLLLTSLFWHR